MTAPSFIHLSSTQPRPGIPSRRGWTLSLSFSGFTVKSLSTFRPCFPGETRLQLPQFHTSKLIDTVREFL